MNELVTKIVRGLTIISWSWLLTIFIYPVSKQYPFAYAVAQI